ncbi:MAG: O-antigen ligase family protein [Vicinamibacterales bacterium]
MLGVGRRALWVSALALLGLIQVSWWVSSVPGPLRIGAASLLVIAAFRPSVALMIWAGLAPLTTSIAEFTNAPLLGAQLLEVMTAAVITGAAVRPATAPRTRLALPAVLMAAVAIASGLAELPARLLTTSQAPVTFGTSAQLLVRHAVDRMPPLDPWYFALLIAEGAAIAWAAESLVRRDAELAPRAVWCALLGHAGVGILNITRLAGASLRGGEFPDSLPGLFLNVRAYTQYDVNAAASILVMVILASIGLETRRARLPLFLATGVVVLALWMAGSRVAMVALVIAFMGVIVLRGRRSVKAIAITGGTVLAAAGLVAWLAIGYPAGRNLGLPTSVASRAVLFRAAFGMAAHAPIVGVGASTFLEESSNYGAAALAPLVYDARTRDNAHNYFLQTLAEQGVLGLLALLVILGAALVPSFRATPQRDVLVKWLTAGIVASILTWMTGHPLLVTEAALMFWLFVGLLAGMSGVRPSGSTATLRWVTGVVVIAVLASIPFRAIREERDANLEHLATGVSQWQPAVDGERFRDAGSSFSLFLPSGSLMVLPLRSATGTALTVELHIDSRPIDAVVAQPDGWREFRIQVPESKSRYVKVDFRLIGSSACNACLWVGKAVPLTR